MWSRIAVFTVLFGKSLVQGSGQESVTWSSNCSTKAAQLYLNDVTELKNTQLELANSKAELQLLTKYNLAKIEEERKKIAMELHDTVGNNFALLRVYL